MVNIETFTDRLTDEIIDYAKANDVELTAADVKDIAIFTLYNFISASSEMEIKTVKESLIAMIGNDEKIAEFLFVTLAGISATDDEIADGGDDIGEC